jgi:hypothetical protein
MRMVTRWLSRVLESDQERGLSTVRRLVLFHLDTFTQTTEEFGHLEALGATIRDLATQLRHLWPAQSDGVPLYPAFRSQSD